MTVFATIFDSTAAFLQTKGISPEISKGKRAKTGALEKFSKQTGISLPDSFASFYTDFADVRRD